MVPYLTNRGGPLIGEEVLSLQGIPVDDLLLTKESEDQMADLAGNAMTSTVVGACIISALVLRQDSLLALTKEPPAKAERAAGKSPSKSPAKGKAAAPLTSLGGSTKHESTRLAEACGALAAYASWKPRKVCVNGKKINFQWTERKDRSGVATIPLGPKEDNHRVDMSFQYA